MSRVEGLPEPPPIPGFAFIRRIGRGGMGEVFLARQESLGGRPVAIKLLFADEQSLSDERMVRFRREAELMGRVDHPNVVTVYDSGTAAGRPYLVMAYVDGGDLRQLMTPGVPMTIDRAKAIVVPVGEALTCLHRIGILHRDLKPENVLIGEDGRPKVADFGIAVLRGGAGALTGTEVGLGTPGYVAPEQQFRLSVDERADQYSLAALSYELLTGQVPLGVPKPPSRYNRALPPALDEVLLKALADDPDDRFPDVPAFLRAFEAALAHRRPWTRAGGYQVVLAAAAAAVAIGLLIVGLVAAWTGSGSPSGDGDGGVAVEPPQEPWKDPLVPFLEDQIERFAFAHYQARSPDEGDERSDWLAALDELLGHGPLAERVKEQINERAYLIWEEKGRGEQPELDNWLAARRWFLEEDRLGEAIDAAIGAEAVSRWEREGRPEGKALAHWVSARRRLVDEGRLLPSRIRDDLGMTFVLVPAGTVGEPPVPGQPGRERGPRLGRPIYLAEHEVTIRLFDAFVAETRHRTTAEVEGWAIGFDPQTGKELRGPEFHWRNPGYLGGSANDHPVVQVSWLDAIAFCSWATASGGNLGRCRLPTEDEWRYAYHLGRSRNPSSGSPPLDLEEDAWFRENSGGQAHPVGTRNPDGLGLFDLLGNVGEWCLGDCSAVDRDAPAAGSRPGRPILGGSWINLAEELGPDAVICHPEDFRYPSVGFRVCREIPEEFY
ncbi:bifunctional serine/threonine-protein kinase/formylglycine-generating enzyme family protein [Tautonia sociabilis]|uniref:DUF2934 domain-containing protein n=1 Tax=Tautonia sociabilis TaxID=2080755 RepID=A0A432MCW6_9BACT|nr:bifunctional serine/threonine-protein kinase/formylglycine-generating enzyme family protein [Tautonia sociabilis]RUL82341.1 DUF2934 domain-containing protein [Tautonia sociabilis]